MVLLSENKHLWKFQIFKITLRDYIIVLINEFECVDIVVKSIDKDRTVCETLKSIEPKPDFFCNGGDQFNDIIPEAPICQERGIELVDGLGDKIQSSSWLIKGSK